MVRYIVTIAVCLSDILLRLFVNKRFSGKETSAFKREESTYMLFRDMVDDIEGIFITVYIYKFYHFCTMWM